MPAAWWTPRRQLGGLSLLGVLLLPLLLRAGGRRADSRAWAAPRPGAPPMSLAPVWPRPEAPPAPAAVPPAPTGGRAAVAPHTLDYRVLAPPSVSAALIDRVLDSYHSPATGQRAVFYDVGVQYGIDPAYCLAFYVVESAAGTKGVARFTHGIGNIRWTPGYTGYEGYRSYANYAIGIADWFQLIRELYVDQWGLHTPDTILPRYAPVGDNNHPLIYAATVKELVNSWQLPYGIPSSFIEYKAPRCQGQGPTKLRWITVDK